MRVIACIDDFDRRHFLAPDLGRERSGRFGMCEIFLRSHFCLVDDEKSGFGLGQYRPD